MTNRQKHLILTLIGRRLAELDWSARQVDVVPMAAKMIDQEIMELLHLRRALTEPAFSGDPS